MEEITVYLTIFGMALVTFFPRLLPAWFLRGKELPLFVRSFLSYIPVAILAALLLPSLVIDQGHIHIAVDNLYLWAAIPAGLVAWKKRSMFATVIVGMLIVAVLRWLLNLP